ncbi:hypothetical protein SH467x_002181 [Pirellulaceae bacterium SH467]
MSSIEATPDKSMVVPGTHAVDPHKQIIEQLLDGQSRWDKRLIQWSNWLNPILVKETRQALKSKQFTWTFGLLIMVVLAWSLLGLLSSIPNIYYASDGRGLLSGYLLILVVPAWLIIPQASFRSMASELDDGTFETLSLSMLRPRHIILGKLNVAALQLIIYLSVIAPCIALTYLLRGVTLETILFELIVVVMTTLGLAMIAIAFASFSRSRALQIVFSLVLILLQLVLTFILCSLLIAVAWQGVGFGGFDQAQASWIALGAAALFLGLYMWVLFACSSALIGVSSANTSTPIRVSLMVTGWGIAMVGVAMAILVSPEATGVFMILLGMHWGIAGSFIVGERGFISTRAKRTLPSGILSKLFFSWVIPGPGTGYVFVVLSSLGASIALVVSQMLASERYWDYWFALIWYAIAINLYLAFYLGLGRLGSWILFRRSRSGRMFGTAVLIAVLNVIAILATCTFSLMSSNYMRMDYEWFCFANPWWTLSEIVPFLTRTTNNTEEFAIFCLGVVTLPIFMINLFLSAKDIVIQRIETPDRVASEHDKKNRREVKREPEPEIDPLA